MPKWGVERGGAWQHSESQSFWAKLAHASPHRSHILAPHFLRTPFLVKYKDTTYVYMCVCLCVYILNPSSWTPHCLVTWVLISSRLVRARLGQLARLSLSSGPGAIVPELASLHPFEAAPKKLYPSVPAGVSLSPGFTEFSTPIDTSEQRCSH